MVVITEELVRRRAEHNNGEMFSLEELSLHQQAIKKIEHLDKWCPKLKILYLQDNLIDKIENVRRLKNLIYLNLALNNIRHIANLEGCESLEKLDLTLNFIDDLSCICNLKTNFNLKRLFLVGNPCCDDSKYRNFVISALPNLNFLDGIEIKKCDRILATRSKLEENERECEGSSSIVTIEEATTGEPKNFTEESFTSKKLEHTPESRVEIHEKIFGGNQDHRTYNLKNKMQNKKARNLIDSNGKILNVNEPRLKFKLLDENDKYILNLCIFKYIDTSLLSVDIQPSYVKVTIKEKVFQLSLVDEIFPDKCKTQRSAVTGHLLLKMPKVEKFVGKYIDYSIKKESDVEHKHKLSRQSTSDGNGCGSKDTILVENFDVPPLI